MQTWLWRTVYSLVAFVNDRFLPTSWQRDPEVIADFVQRLWISLKLYVTEQPEAPKRYRGVIIEDQPETIASTPVITQATYYRGCRIDRTPTGDVAVPFHESPYIPPYQRWMDTKVRTMLLNLGLGNRDLTPTPTVVERIYRGARY
ncbi:MAG: hypothetical protein OHK0012_14250 [Synechococcales cyanobacterium]